MGRRPMAIAAEFHEVTPPDHLIIDPPINFSPLFPLAATLERTSTLRHRAHLSAAHLCVVERARLLPRARYCIVYMGIEYFSGKWTFPRNSVYSALRERAFFPIL